jgi:predicted RNase H-like HicB family nuclease
MADAPDYPVVINWSDEDQLFIGHAPDLPRCMAHGDTREEAESSLRKAIALWIDVCREVRDSVPEPRSAIIDWFDQSPVPASTDGVRLSTREI